VAWRYYCDLCCGRIAVILLREYIGALLLAKNYRTSVDLMPWVALGYSLLMISSVFEKPNYAYKKTKAVLYIWISGAAASIVIGIPLIYYWVCRSRCSHSTLFRNTAAIFHVHGKTGKEIINTNYVLS